MHGTGEVTVAALRAMILVSLPDLISHSSVAAAPSSAAGPTCCSLLHGRRFVLAFPFASGPLLEPPLNLGSRRGIVKQESACHHGNRVLPR